MYIIIFGATRKENTICSQNYLTRSTETFETQHTIRFSIYATNIPHVFRWQQLATKNDVIYFFNK